MGRLIVSAQMTADAVMDHIEGWFNPRLEAEAYGLGGQDGPAPAPYSLDQINTADALVLGRLTYEGLSTVWPGMSDPYGLADRINSMPKYVASRTLDPPLRWNASLIEGDPAGRVAELKQELSGNLLIYGCGELAYHLARHGLVDEIRFWLHPVVWGDGVRPFQAGRPPVRLRLISAVTLTSGLVLLSYRPDPPGDGA
jgi:dihydrofolate reductase